MSQTASACYHALLQTAEGVRLQQADAGQDWRRWGPYLSERQWGVVREDYSADGTPWAYFPHDLARSRAYRWGEDGLGGFGNDALLLCLSVALWNGADPILKERLFGLSNAEGNHGEDVKELYYYLDGTPTHSYMRMLYKYPQQAYPYERLIAENARRGLQDAEFELLDTGIFDGQRYFDVQIEYAKAAVDDILLLITVTNRSADAARLHVLPQLWARNIWSWEPDVPRPLLARMDANTVSAQHAQLPPMSWWCDGTPELLFCDNDTNPLRVGAPARPGYFKDGINDAVVLGHADAVNPAQLGTKMAAHHVLDVAGGGQALLRVRLRAGPATGVADFDAILQQRRAEADEFYAAVQEGVTDAEERAVQRQALAGMLWSKQFYHFDVRRWLQGDPLQPVPPDSRETGRDSAWGHLVNRDIIAMPDKWEYPWYAAWDQAFHCVTYTMLDPAFAKAQLVLLMQARFMHPNGQLPAYEWAFGDANPPVHAWAALQIYQIDRQQSGVGDTIFLERMFHALILNFTWWVNRKDSADRNIFQGGFLGLDNISFFDRSKPLPDGSSIDQSDGSAWVAMYALNLMRMALELAVENHAHEDMATKFFEHFLYIAEAIHAMGGATGTGLWDDDDGFYYDVLRRPDAPDRQLRVRSLVGLIPLLAVEVLSDTFIQALPQFRERMVWFLRHRADLAELVSHFADQNAQEIGLLAIMRRDRMRRVLLRMLDEDEFLSGHGIRSLSKFHQANPCVFEEGDQVFKIAYAPANSPVRLFGGNSNWRGPVWMPLNYLLIEALYCYHTFYGDEFRLECPSRSGKLMTLAEIADTIALRVKRLFLRDANGRRPIFGDNALLQNDPAFRDHLLFNEYFDGDTGAGLGASHQTGWSALIAMLLKPRHEREAVQPAPAEVTTR